MFELYRPKSKLCMFVLLVLLFSSSSIFSSSFSGYVRDDASQETLIGATVLIVGVDQAGKEFKKGAYSNKRGYFSISNVPPGVHKVTSSYLGYEKLNIEVKIENDDIRKNLNLKAQDIMTESVNVIAEREAEKRQISISKVDIPVQQIKNIRIGGESDVMRSLQLLPNVLTSSQISSGLYVRGGTPDQNLVLVDGATVYNPSHLFGFISSFNTEAIKDVELIKGAYPAEYGGRLSSVLNIVQKDGNKKEYHGQISTGLISTKGFVEGPTVEDGSFFMAGRITNLGLLLSVADTDPDNPLPDYGFYDLNFKLNQGLGENDRITIGAFNSADEMIYKAFGFDATIGISNILGSFEWTHLFDENLFSRLNISTSQYTNGLEFDNNGFIVSIDNSIRDITGKYSLEWFTNDYLTMKGGVEYNNYSFNYYQNFTGSEEEEEDNEDAKLDLNIVDHNFAAYAQSNILFDDFTSIQAGLRYAYFNFSNIHVFEPRVSFRHQLTGDVTMKAGFGVYHQNLKLATQPDFSFFDTWLGTDSTLNLGKSYHYVMSIETTPFEGYGLNFDIYYKDLKNINELRTNSLGGDTAEDALFEGEGSTYGAEVFLKKKYGALTGWLGYGYGYVEARFDEVNNGKVYNPKYDRRHDLKVVAQWEINKSWEVGGAFKFQSGQPYTGISSKVFFKFEGDNYYRGKTVGLSRYNLRLPPSHQLDIYGSYKFKFFDTFESRITLDVYNVYNRRDIWFRYFNAQNETENEEEKKEDDNSNQYIDVMLLPIIPTLSLEINF